MTATPTTPTAGAARSLVELRVLDGANLYFPRAAIKLTLDLSGLQNADEERLRGFGHAVGGRVGRPWAPHTELRQRFVGSVVLRLVRRIAHASGTTRLAVRSRPGPTPDTLVVAYPWRRRGTAEALGTEVAGIIDLFLADGAAAVAANIGAASHRVATAAAGPPPPTIRARIPVVAVTGTNGKTTTSRLIAHMGRCAGLHVGWSSTDGIYDDGRLVEGGDYSGPSGAGHVLALPGVQLAVTETARGGILLRGVGVTHNDVSVVTNVTADHLGLQGIDTVDQLAEVKAVITHITRSSGWCVLNADDPRVLAMRSGTRAPVWAFSRDANAPGLRDVLDAHGRVTTVLDDMITVLGRGRGPDPLIALTDVPLTLSGLSRFNIENVLAATSAGLGLGLSRETVIEALRTFSPGPEHNPGRMNIYSLGAVTVVIDLAHNEAGVAALLEVMDGLRAPGARLLLAMGTAGDRTDEILAGIAEIAARDSDRLVIVHKDDYLRGRTPSEMDVIFRAAAAGVGVEDVPSLPDELTGLATLVGEAGPGDVVGVMAHSQRPQLDAWLHQHGAVVDDPDALRVKVLAARAGHRPG